MNRQCFFDVRASWEKSDQDDALKTFDYWHNRNCPQLFKESDRARLNPYFLSACDSWKRGTTGLGLFGPTGSTKTRSMWELIRRIAQPWPRLETQKWSPTRWRHTVRYDRNQVFVVRDVEFARECAEQFKDHRDGNLLKTWRTCDVLFIDDLGKSRITERVQTELFDLVDSRTSNGLPILFTSNFDGKGLARRFASPADAAPILRRLSESCQIVRSDGKTL